MKKHFGPSVCLLLLLAILLPAAALAIENPLPIQDCHRVTLTKQDTTHENGSIVRIWEAQTANDAVTQEINAISRAYADRLGPDLPAAANKTSQNSRLDVEVRYSRTGLTWMSFLVQARVSYHHTLVSQELTSRTYDMTTGDPVTLQDIFPEDSEAWSLLTQRVRDEVARYFPDESVDLMDLYANTGRDAVCQLPFTLHGMSLVLHVYADRFYPQHHSLIEVTFMYPEIRDMMTERARTETDNLSYYNTCALTFDDGPSRVNTTLVLNALMEGGARGTFFVIGNRISGNADLVQKENDNGHSVGTHNWAHANVLSVAPANLYKMVEQCNEAMIGAIGKKPDYDRVPYGLYPRLIKYKVGWPLIQWSLDTYDWRGRSSKTVLNTVKEQISDGDIILMHDVKDNTPVSASMIIEYLQEQGYLFLTVDELLAKDGVALQPDTVYFRCVNGDTSKKDRSK